MTAGQVAYGLEETKEITINYRATDELFKYKFAQNPMSQLEWTKA